MIDARGQSCPIPVVMVQQEVKKNNPRNLEVIVDSKVCVENISRYAERQGYQIAVSEDSGDYTMQLKK